MTDMRLRDYVILGRGEDGTIVVFRRRTSEYAYKRWAESLAEQAHKEFTVEHPGVEVAKGGDGWTGPYTGSPDLIDNIGEDE